jgi:hypothetical protein
MRSILPFLALAACSPPPAARTGTTSPAEPGAAREQPAATATAELRPLVSHLAPGDPVIVAIHFAPELGTALRVESLEVALARPDGTTQRSAPGSSGGAPDFVDLTAGGGLDLSLAGRYRLSLSGLVGGRRFTAGEIEIEVMGDGRLPLAEIARRARRELERRQPGLVAASSQVVEGPGGERAVRFAAGATLVVVRLTPAGAVLGVETGAPP